MDFRPLIGCLAALCALSTPPLRAADPPFSLRPGAPSQQEEPEVEEPQERGPRGLWGFSIVGGAASSSHFDAIYGAQVSYGGFISQLDWVHIAGGITYAPRLLTSDFKEIDADAFHPAWFNVQYRYHFAGEGARFSPFVAAGVGVQWVLWTWTDEFGAIHNDSVGGIELYAGIGGVISQGETYAVTADLTPGVDLTFPETGEGFENDFLDTFFFVRMTITFHVDLGL